MKAYESPKWLSMHKQGYKVRSGTMWQKTKLGSRRLSSHVLDCQHTADQAALMGSAVSSKVSGLCDHCLPGHGRKVPFWRPLPGGMNKHASPSSTYHQLMRLADRENNIHDYDFDSTIWKRREKGVSYRGCP